MPDRGNRDLAVERVGVFRLVVRFAITPTFVQFRLLLFAHASNLSWSEAHSWSGVASANGTHHAIKALLSFCSSLVYTRQSSARQLRIRSLICFRFRFWARACPASST